MMSNFSAISDSEEYVRLDSMQEICGCLEAMEDVDSMLYIRLSSGTLRYPANSEEAEICRQKLADEDGSWVSILRGPFPEQPIVVNKASEE